MIDHPIERNTLRLRGAAASFLWGYRVAATVKGWTIRRVADGRWQLVAELAVVQAFYLRQRPLLFTAPRKGGFWVWPVEEFHQVDAETSRLVAMLGPPEQ